MNLTLYKANGQGVNDLENISLTFHEPMHELWGRYLIYWPSIICAQDNYTRSLFTGGWLVAGGMVIFK